MSDLSDLLPGWRPWDDTCAICGQHSDEPLCPRCLHPSMGLDLDDLTEGADT